VKLLAGSSFRRGGLPVPPGLSSLSSLRLNGWLRVPAPLRLSRRPRRRPRRTVRGLFVVAPVPLLLSPRTGQWVLRDSNLGWPLPLVLLLW